MTDVTAAEGNLALDLDACAAEPIHVPGGIQPHGALMVVEPGSGRVLQVSANLELVLGQSIAPGERLSEAGEAGARLAAELARWTDRDDDTALLRTLDLGDRTLQLSAHRTRQGAILEFEAPPAREGETLELLYPRVRRFVDEIADLQDVAALAQIAVRTVRAITGFNRVLLYSFDRKGDGTVLAEDGDGVLPSYLGLRFPASDIPPQARELYRLNRIRLIPTASYTPAPIQPAISPVDGKPLDLSLAALRSVSPVHLEYMRNMGTAASMSISLLVDGELWGLISGHSRDPWTVNAQVRTACDFLGQIVSLQIGAREQALSASRRIELKKVEARLLARIAARPNFQTGLVDNQQDWLDLTQAEGAAVLTAGGVLTAGLTPSPLQLRELAAWLRQTGQEVFATDSLAEHWPQAAEFAAQASGLIAVSISQLHADYLLWFRPEVIRTVSWGGDPQKPMTEGPGRLHPRQSFATWKEQVRLTSRPWSAVEIENARDFRSAIQNFVLRRAEERAELTDQLERINKELESFSYSVSHDLRAPFRHIVGYAELLSERATELDSRSRHYLASIVESARTAGRLVDDLLSFSQLGRATIHKAPFDMNKLVSEVRRALEPDMAGREIVWTVGALPPAYGDPNLVRQVLMNLMGNAVKYTRPREVAEISIEGEDLGDVTAYTVRDNGVGFDMAYGHKLFGVFQRLHRAEEFEGTGIGLALAKRVVDRHQGTLQAVGALGKGASFTFALPKAEPAEGRR